MFRIFLAALAPLFLIGCSSMKVKSFVEKPPVLVHKLGAVELTEKASYRVLRGQDTRPWQWRRRNSIGAPPQSFVEPYFINDKDAIVLSLGGGVARYDTWLGSKVWSLDIPVGAASQVAVEEPFVYVAGMDRVLRKMRLEDGEVLWTSNLSSESTGGVALGENIVYVTASDNSLWAIDKENGRSLWTYKRPNSERAILWSLRGAARPVLSPDGMKLYVGFADGFFVALNAMNGSTHWERNFERPGRFRDADTSPALSADGSKIFLSLVDGDFVALDSSSGKNIWKLSWGSHSAPLVDDKEDAVYYSTNDNRLVKASLRTGTINWIAELEGLGMGSSPVKIPGGFLALTTTRFGLVIVDESNGSIVYRDRLGQGIIAPPSFLNGRLLVISAWNEMMMYRVSLPREG